jgi:hypothetical protein
MLINFEPWLMLQNPSPDAQGCYDEAFLAYKVGAYRAALLFSYLGFMTFLRERIGSSPAPAGVPAGLWTQIQAQAGSEDAWDTAVFEATQRRANPAPVFLVSEDLRQQVMYWKNRRNDCAHSKNNIIDAAHVDQFWAFTKSNLNKFMVNGSRAVMLTQIETHFNPALTAPGQPVDNLVMGISQAIVGAELSDFLTDLAQSFDANRNQADVAANGENPNKLRLYDRCLAIGEANLQIAVRNQTISDRRLLLQFLRAYPARVTILAGHAQQVRRLWSEDLFSGGLDDISLLASLLRNNLIPPNEREQCQLTLIRRGISAAPNAVDEATLAENGFYQHLEAVTVAEGMINRFAWANTSSGIIEHHLSRSPITVEMARALYLAFDSVYNARDLRQRLNTFFTVNAAKRTEFRNLEQANALIGLPQHLPALHNP